jgi:hypothetical protein
LKNKIWRDPITLFALRFALIFGILIVPWSGWNEAYGVYFRGLGQAAFSCDEGNRIVLFAPNDGPANSRGLGTRISLANRDQVDSSGKALVKSAQLDTRSIGWVPTALTVALIAATPISWRRRAWALAGGLILVHGFILFSLQAWIWNNSPALFLLTLSDFWKEVVDDLNYTLINQMGASFAVPVLIWILVTFNSQDAFQRNLEKSRGGKIPPPAGRGKPLRRDAVTCVRE